MMAQKRAVLARCGGLNERDPYSSYIWMFDSNVIGTVWEGLADVALLEEIWHWELALWFQKPMPCPVSSLSVSCLWIWCKLSATTLAPCLSACCHVPHHDNLEPWAPKLNVSLYKLPCVYHGNIKATKTLCEPNHLNLISETHTGGREPVPESCPLTHAHKNN